VPIAFWSKLHPVDFNRDFAACTKSELDLFEVPPTQISVVCGYSEQKGLTSALTDQGPYEFAVIGAGDDYIDLANAYLLGCTSAILIRKCHSMCSVAWSADVWSFFAW
jgi:hypothetical protein